MKNKQKKTIYLVVGMLLMIAIVVGSGAAFAKYIQTKELQGTVDQTTVFASDDLKTAENGIYPTYIVYATSVSFSIRNYDGGKTATVSFDYTVSAKIGETEKTFVANSNTKSFSANTQKTETYTLSGTAGDQITVTAQTADGAQTIGAVFHFAEGVPTQYSIEETDHYFTVLLNTGTTVGDIQIKYGENLLPDNSNALMKDWFTTTDTYTLAGLLPNSHYELVFFKKPGTDSGHEIIVTPMP